MRQACVSVSPDPSGERFCSGPSAPSFHPTRRGVLEHDSFPVLCPHFDHPTLMRALSFRTETCGLGITIAAVTFPGKGLSRSWELDPDQGRRKIATKTITAFRHAKSPNA